MIDKDVKPHLACDYEESKLKFPCIVMPKIDGVRGINLNGTITGRSLKEFKNKFVTQRFSLDGMLGFDGELVLGDWCDPVLCSKTTGFVNRKTPKPGKPTESEDLVWYIFDYLAPGVIDKPYEERLRHLALHFRDHSIPNCKMVPWKYVTNLEELYAFEEECLDAGFEGVIIRDPTGMHKSGRSSPKVGAYLRIKRFIDFEGTIVNLKEAMENTNEAKTNELGRTERSTHQENMVPKGMVGMIQMESLQDVLSNGNVMIAKGQIVDVGPGNMLHDQRVKAWLDFINNTEENLVGQIGKAKFFPKGQKDKPRFPTFIGVRAEEDMID